MNALTDWLDLSSVYGSTEKELEDVRDPDESQYLRVSGSGRKGKSFLPRCDLRNPEERNKIEGCMIDECNADKVRPSPDCFYAGDFRVNDQHGLATMHTIWMREHNRCSLLFYTEFHPPSPILHQRPDILTCMVFQNHDIFGPTQGHWF